MGGSADHFLLAWHRERPGYEDFGLREGSVIAPAWVIAVVGGGVVLSGLLYFGWRLRRVRRSPRISHATVKRR